MTRWVFLLCALPWRWWWCCLRRHRRAPIKIFARPARFGPQRLRSFAEYECYTCQCIAGRATFLGDQILDPDSLPVRAHPFTQEEPGETLDG